MTSSIPLVKVQASRFNPSLISVEDFKMYFKDTFVLLEEGKYSSLVKVLDATRTMVATWEPASGEHKAIPRPLFNFSWEKPEEGFYVLDDDVMILSGVPYRGVLKGFGGHNVKLRALCEWKLRTSGDEALATALRQSEKLPSAKETLDKILSNQIFGAPVNRQIAITQGYLSVHPTIWSSSCPIGSVIDRSKIHLEKPVFREEVENAFGQGYTYLDYFPRTRRTPVKKESVQNV